MPFDQTRFRSNSVFYLVSISTPRCQLAISGYPKEEFSCLAILFSDIDKESKEGIGSVKGFRLVTLDRFYIQTSKHKFKEMARSEEDGKEMHHIFEGIMKGWSNLE